MSCAAGAVYYCYKTKAPPKVIGKGLFHDGGSFESGIEKAPGQSVEWFERGLCYECENWWISVKMKLSESQHIHCTS